MTTIHLAIFGIGNVGSTLINQIQNIKSKLLTEQGLDIQIPVITNSTLAFFSNDISKEKNILPLVEEFFLDDNIPEGWYLCYDKKTESYYYYNKCLDKSTWENPSYIFWKEKIEIERNKNMETQNKSKKENNESNSLTILLDIDDIK